MSQLDDIGEAGCAVVCDECCPRLSPKLQLFCYCMVTPALIVLVVMLVLYVNPKNPEFSVEEFYVSAFNKTSSNNATSNTISFNIKLRNQNAGIGLYYDDPVNVTFSYIPRESNNQIIWQYSVPKFYQGNAQSRRLVDEVQPLGAVQTPVFNQTVLAEHSSVLPTEATNTGLEPLLYFKVDFVTKVRFRLIGKPHAKNFALSASVPIGANTGEKFAKRGIQASPASWIGWGGARAVVMVVLTAVNLILM